jgi:hypothetical protein
MNRARSRSSFGVSLPAERTARFTNPKGPAPVNSTWKGTLFPFMRTDQLMVSVLPPGQQRGGITSAFNYR